MLRLSMTTSHNGSATPLVRLEDVGKTYHMGELDVQVVRHVSLEIYAGELLVMVGPSGSGKSTLLNILGGLDRPSAGRVWFRDLELSACSRRELTRFRREAVGFVFQFYNLVPNLTARENVLVSTEISSTPMDVDRALALVGLTDRADHFPSQLSGGEQQRVAIARAVAKNPELLLCDEPTGALDYETGKRILRLLADLRQQLGTTVLLITHNAAIAHMADRVVRLRSGEVVEVHANPAPLAPEEIEW
jgi:putative ABC transport system ATP-binding protein